MVNQDSTSVLYLEDEIELADKIKFCLEENFFDSSPLMVELTAFINNRHITISIDNY